MVLDNYNIPWLMWIQMFIFLLLLLLLCVFGIFSSDIIDNSFSSSADSVPSTSGSSISRRFFSEDPFPISHPGLGFSVNSSIVQSNQVGSSQTIKGEITAAETRRVRRREDEECSLEKDTSRNFHHPCNLFQLAGSAFLKCFGLGWSSSTEETEDPLRPEPKKQK